MLWELHAQIETPNFKYIYIHGYIYILYIYVYIKYLYIYDVTFFKQRFIVKFMNILNTKYIHTDTL